MSDMNPVIVPKSDQLNSDDLIGGSKTIKITKVSVKEGSEQPVSIFFEGDNGKPYKPCKSMCRVLVKSWGPESSKYVGRSMTLYRDEKVTWAGMAVGGIRISHLSDIKEAMTMALTQTKSSRKPFTVKPLTEQPKQSAPDISKDDLKKSGDDAAGGGVESYTRWLSKLKPEEKDLVREYHQAWVTTAKSKKEG